MKQNIIIGWLGIGSLVFNILGCSPETTYDIVILNGTIVDGTGEEAYEADLGINGDTIAFIGNLKERQGTAVFEADGHIISPGFIDIHTHCDNGLDHPETRANLTYLMQGVTSVVTGNCGYRKYSIEKTRSLYDSIGGIGTNALPLIGFGTVRSAVLGREDRAPSAEELEKMKEVLRQALQDGVWGMSSGLQYVPQKYSTMEEVIEVTKVLKEFDVIYTTHMRSEEEQIMEALAEALQIITEAGVPLNISHLKANGRMNWKYMKDLFEVVEQAQANGAIITADMYPYDKSATTELYDILHIPAELEALTNLQKKLNSDIEGEEKNQARAAFEAALQEALKDPSQRAKIKTLTEKGIPGNTNWVAKGGWNYFSIVNAPKNPDLLNKMFIELAEESGREPFEIAADLIIEEGSDIVISLSTMLEDNLLLQLKKDWVMVSSDGYAVHPDHTGVHPRSYGSAARVLRKYVREENILTLEEGIYKMTGLPAETLGMEDRGILKTGQVADLVVFDQDEIYDGSTYLDPHQYASGIELVFVNGDLAVEKGEFKEVYSGRFLLKK